MLVLSDTAWKTNFGADACVLGRKVDRSLLVRVKGDPEVARRSLDPAIASISVGAASFVVPMDQAGRSCRTSIPSTLWHILAASPSRSPRPWPPPT